MMAVAMRANMMGGVRIGCRDQVSRRCILVRLSYLTELAGATLRPYVT
jgi:hypothetical protein